jgi:hypothetical protein
MEAGMLEKFLATNLRALHGVLLDQARLPFFFVLFGFTRLVFE